MANLDQVAGVILAGGLSRRMGGGDKGLLELGGSTMLGHVVERLRPQVSRLIINANGDPSRYAQFGLPVVADTIGGFAGPLAGMLAGMRWAIAEMPDARAIATVSCDTPFLPADLVSRLQSAAANRPGAIALAQSQSGVHQVVGLWPLSLMDELERQLRAGLRKVLQWTGQHETIPVPFGPVDVAGRMIDPFFNANSLEDLATARALLAGAAS
ncbi:MAG: molybdenum cofactor guanylyltransferase MobA [Bacteroidota bacterium]